MSAFKLPNSFWETSQSMIMWLQVQVNQKISKTAHIKELNAEIDRLKAELFATREKNGIYVPADQYEQREESSKKNQFRIEELEAAMEVLVATHQAEVKQQLDEKYRIQQVWQALCTIVGARSTTPCSPKQSLRSGS